MNLKIYREKEIENIIFDFGNVILDIDISLSIKEFEKLGLSGFKVEDIHPQTKDFFLDLEVGAISDDKFTQVLRDSYKNSDHITDQRIWDAWNKLLLEFDPARFELLKEVGKSYNIYLLSNTNHPHRVFFLEKFKREFGYDMESLFTKCYYSDAMKMRKPDVEIYQSVIDDSNLTPEKTLFIDDNFCNFSGAEEVGLNCYHLTGGETIIDIFE